MYREDISSSAAPVRLNFFHVMSRINFQLANEGAADIVRVNKLELEGVNRTGTFSITPAPLLSGGLQTDDYDYSWTDLSNIGNVSVTLDAEVPKNEECALFPDDKALFMIPQSRPDNSGVIIKVYYTLSNANNSDKEVTLTAEAPKVVWEPGKIYTYIVSVKQQSITFKVNVVDWQDGAENDLTVPRK